MPGISAVSPPISAAPACLAAFRNARDHPRGHLRIELAAGEIVEEEQRLGALHHYVVHAHRHEVDADRIVQAGLGGDLDLGANAIVRGDQDGIGKSRRFQIEEPAEAAKCGCRARPGARLGERLYSLHKRVAGIDVDARLRIGARWFSCCAVGHGDVHGCLLGRRPMRALRKKGRSGFFVIPERRPRRIRDLKGRRHLQRSRVRTAALHAAMRTG